MKKVVGIVLIAVFAGYGGAWIFEFTHSESPASQIPISLNSPQDQEPGESFFASNRAIPDIMSDDFVLASSKSTKSVVYIKNISQANYGYSWFDYFFGEAPRSYQSVSSGSGVIFSADGYIVTNNHVIEGADAIEVVFNRKEYEAILVGKDPGTDIAVLKIEADQLPAVYIGNSKDLQVGEWVLAIGNPFNLNSTVTAGIVSAKGRKIDILKDKFPVESFIQTDAAINPGNSGGALVNKEGKLVGINTAIFSKTGSYVGYGFAVPIDIVGKIVKDIIRYGEVQKAFFGGNVANLDANIANRLDIKLDNSRSLKGVVLTYAANDGAAYRSGLEEGDVILAINGEVIESESQFEETISYFSPGDEIEVTALQNGKKVSRSLTLLNRDGNTDITRRMVYSSKTLGAEFEKVSKVERDLHDIEGGVKIVKVNTGLIQSMRLTEGYIITNINGRPIEDPKMLTDILTQIRGRVEVRFVNPKGQKSRALYYF
jgi:Do/DeqQ family serine protease